MNLFQKKPFSGKMERGGAKRGGDSESNNNNLNPAPRLFHYQRENRKEEPCVKR